MGGRVPPAAVGAKIAGRHQLLAREAVDERRLADARRAQRGHGPALAEVLRERVDALAGDVADRMDRYADRNRLDLEQRRLDVGAEIGLGQDDDRGGAALPAQGQVPLEAAGIEVAVEARGQEDDVDVRGDDLLDRVAAVAWPPSARTWCGVAGPPGRAPARRRRDRRSRPSRRRPAGRRARRRRGEAGRRARPSVPRARCRAGRHPAARRRRARARGRRRRTGRTVLRWLDPSRDARATRLLLCSVETRRRQSLLGSTPFGQPERARRALLG